MNLEQNLEKYLQRRKTQIVQSLRSLAKAKCLVTGRFNTGKDSFLSVVIDVIPDKNVVIFDYGQDEAVNRKLLSTSHVDFMTRYKGIKVSFSSKRIKKTEYQGQAVFVVPIPESLYWMEHREYYRVKVPVMNSAVCRIPVAGENSGEALGNLDLRVANIGARGIALDFPGEHAFPGEVGTRLCNCILVLPGHSEKVDLEIRHRTPVQANEDGGESWIGCALVKPSETLQSRILQFMQSVERQQKELER
ncbi:MAG: flagellar brake protein [Methylococcales bacterium]